MRLHSQAGCGIGNDPFVVTEDGSLSLMDARTREWHHNRAGAFQEAFHNYAVPSAALTVLTQNRRLDIIDACFGLGYNSLVTLELLLAHNAQGQVTISAIEHDQSLWQLLPAILAQPCFARTRELLSPLAIAQPATTACTLMSADGMALQFRVFHAELRATIRSFDQQFDLVFHDPFSPRKQPELWSVDLFREYNRLLRARQGKVLTYSSAIAVRIGLIQAGFQIRRSQAVGGKSGGTIALIPEAPFDPRFCFELTEDERIRLSSTRAVPYRDPSLSLDSRCVLRSREEELGHRCPMLG